MIIRVFRPTIHPGKESEFESFLHETAVPLVSQQAGLIAQHVGRSQGPSSTEYLYVTSKFAPTADPTAAQAMFSTSHHRGGDLPVQIPAVTARMLLFSG